MRLCEPFSWGGCTLGGCVQAALLGYGASHTARHMHESLPLRLALHPLWPLQVVVPVTYDSYTSRRVLTTEWLEGEKLSQVGHRIFGDLA